MNIALIVLAGIAVWIACGTINLIVIKLGFEFMDEDFAALSGPFGLVALIVFALARLTAESCNWLSSVICKAVIRR